MSTWEDIKTIYMPRQSSWRILGNLMLASYLPNQAKVTQHKQAHLWHDIWENQEYIMILFILSKEGKSSVHLVLNIFLKLHYIRRPPNSFWLFLVKGWGVNLFIATNIFVLKILINLTESQCAAKYRFVKSVK